MNRSILIHGGLLIAALITAYFVWTRDPTSTNDEITIVSLRGVLDKAIYASDDRTVTVTHKKDDRGSYHWLSVETMEAPAPMPRMRPQAPVPQEQPAPAPAVTPQPAPAAQPIPRVAPDPAARPIPRVTPDPADRPIPRVAPDPAARPIPRVVPAPVSRPIPKVVPRPNPRQKINPQAAPDPALDPASPPQPNPAPQVTPAASITPTTSITPTASITPAASRPELKKIRKVNDFLGNKAADLLMEGLANLSAIRSLGQVDSNKLKDFGLDESKKTLTLVSGSMPRVFVIGDNTFGNQDTYLLSKDDGRVYVIRPRLLQDFLYAESRLMERELLDFPITEVDRVVVTAGDKKKTLLQKNPSEPANAYWVDAAEPEKRKDFYRNWFEKLNQLRAVEYVPKRNKVEGLTPVLEISYFRDGNSKGVIKMFKKVTLLPDITSAAPAGGGDYYTESTYSRTQVKLSRHLGDELARDLENLFKE